MFKKITSTFLLGLFFAPTLFSQITLDQNDFPEPGQSFEIISGFGFDPTMNINDSLSAGFAGADGVYDFSKLSYFFTDTGSVHYLTPAVTPSPQHYPTATVAALDDVQTNGSDTSMYIYAYYRSTATTFTRLGFSVIADTTDVLYGNHTGVYDTFRAEISPLDIVLSAQYQLGYTNPETYTFEVIFGSLGFRITNEDDTEADGYGLLKTPLGVFDVLRVKETNYFTQEILANGTPVNVNRDTSYYYLYYAKGIGHPLLKVFMEPNWQEIKSFEYAAVQPSCPGFSVSSAVENVSCHGENDGSVNFTMTGGYEPFSYTFSSGSPQLGFAAGNYSVTVTDANQCTQTASFNISQPDALQLTLSAEGAYGGDNGTALVSVAGGTAPYIYLWDNGATTDSITGLAPDDYTVTVTDDNGCVVTGTVTVFEIVNHITEINSVKMQVYPNPAEQTLFVAFEKPLPDLNEILLFDSAGKQIKKIGMVNENSSVIQIDVRDLGAGMHWLKLVGENSISGKVSFLITK